MRNILITGGAGFIGSHLADELLNHGYAVTVIDTLVEQVHGPSAERPLYLHQDAELIRADVRDADALGQALIGIDAVFHFAAMVGVGQSMYDIARYTEVNNLGTATLLEKLIDHPVAKLVVASSMSIYGEGLYRNRGGESVEIPQRSLAQLQRGDWELWEGERQLVPVPTPETKTPDLSSIYALSKYDQERMALIVGKAYGIPTTALRFFNVYGPRQALSNPYTGVLAIMASRLLNNRPPLIFEDGHQRRDFINVKDVANACRLALESQSAAGDAFNIGSGNHYTIWELTHKLAKVMNKTELEPEITGQYRAGDIRHCFADITKARQWLGFTPRVSLSEGMTELAGWLENQIAVDRVDQAKTELTSRGLTVGAVR